MTEKTDISARRIAVVCLGQILQQRASVMSIDRGFVNEGEFLFDVAFHTTQRMTVPWLTNPDGGRIEATGGPVSTGTAVP